jgi:hypothetical protein
MNIRYFLLSLIVFLTLPSFSPFGYDDNYVSISSVNDYYLVYMQREASGKRIKAKYFCAKDPHSGSSVADRYNDWKIGKNIICATSGTYMTKADWTVPEGLSVDNGIIVNRTPGSYDGLVIVYATGGIVVSNLENADLRLQGNGMNGQTLDVRGNSWDRSSFLSWAEDAQATVFQTHLLVYKNKNQVGQFNSEPDKRERRFLVVGEDEDGQLVHVIIHMPEHNSLYAATEKVMEFMLDFKDMTEITFMLNLDTGMQNIFELYNSDGSQNTLIEGETPLSNAANLLVYYYD